MLDLNGVESPVSGTQHACYTASEKEFTMSISSEFNPLFNVRRTKKREEN